MATFSKSQSNNRSISLPNRSHPTTDKLEVELNKIKSRESTSFTQNTKKIINSLSGLMDLYKCFDDLLNLQMTKKALSHHQCEKFMYTLQDEFLTLLDICGTSRDIMSEIKENARQIQTSLRPKRRKGDPNIESIVSNSISFRKKVIKDSKKLVVELKQMESKIGTQLMTELDHHASSVIRSIQEVASVSSIVLNSICLFSCAPVSKPKTRWSVVSKLVQKGTAVACENQVKDLNELQSLDIALDQLCKSDSSELKEDKKVHGTQTSLKSLEIGIGDIEDKLENLFRGLIKTRVNLLNISSSLVT